MLRFSANLSTLFPEHAFLERFAAARQAGFSAVEFQYPYAHPVAELKKRLDDNALCLVLMNAPPGDGPHERGLACIANRTGEFRDSVERALDYASGLGCGLVHVLSGRPMPDQTRAQSLDVCAGNLSWAADRARQAGVAIVVEALNPFDVPFYLLGAQVQAAEMVRAVESPHCGLLFDFYHCQRTEGDAVRHFTALLPLIRHVQIADVPDRQEPGTGETDWPAAFAAIEESAYAGFVGCEYRPAGRTLDGLGWMDRYIPGAGNEDRETNQAQTQAGQGR